MKQLLTFILCGLLALSTTAQTDTTEVKIMKKNVVTVIEDSNRVEVAVGRGVEIVTDDWGDTTHIRIGRRTFKVIDGDNGTYVKVEKDMQHQQWSGRFNPHWAGLEVGVNVMTGADYSLYTNSPSNGDYDKYPDFMDLNVGKSLTWNLNFMEFAFKNERKTFGVVTGLGFSFTDYSFNDPITLQKEGTITVPIGREPDLNNREIKKSKLHVNYLTAPLMLEVKTPLRMGSSRLYLAGGVIGSLYLGSHTKYKYYKGDKFKSKSGFQINQWKYELTGRIGFGDFCVFANYSMTSLFKNNRGPEVYPLMIGISFPNI